MRHVAIVSALLLGSVLAAPMSAVAASTACDALKVEYDSCTKLISGGTANWLTYAYCRHIYTLYGAQCLLFGANTGGMPTDAQIAAAVDVYVASEQASIAAGQQPISPDTFLGLTTAPATTSAPHL